MNSLKIIENVLTYAQLADKMGFNRIWLTEHHISDPLAAWYNPQQIITLIAGMTKNIITGIAGCQLAIHNPYHIALDYKLLANLFPGRIDLGVASGGPDADILELIGLQNYSLENKKRKLYFLLKDEKILIERGLVIPPYKGAIPNIWKLAYNYQTIGEALDNQLNFSRSLFHGNDILPYKDQLVAFKESFFIKYKEYPQTTLAISGCCHLTDAKAKALAETSGYKGISKINVVGSIERFKDIIYSYQEQYGFSEFTFLDLARSPSDRRRSLELIQKAFDL
jgi:hypothetical protein